MRPLSFGCSARSAYPKVRRLTFPSFVGSPLDEGGDVAKKILWNEEAVKQGAEELDPGDLRARVPWETGRAGRPLGPFPCSALPPQVRRGDARIDGRRNVDGCRLCLCGVVLLSALPKRQVSESVAAGSASC
jgi:hypothetical protein